MTMFQQRWLTTTQILHPIAEELLTPPTTASVYFFNMDVEWFIVHGGLQTVGLVAGGTAQLKSHPRFHDIVRVCDHLPKTGSMHFLV